MLSACRNGCISYDIDAGIYLKKKPKRLLTILPVDYDYWRSGRWSTMTIAGGPPGECVTFPDLGIPFESVQEYASLKYEYGKTKKQVA